MRIGIWRRTSAALTAAVFVSAIPAAAHATGVTEFPDNGSEQAGRGGAWVARASDPLAAFYNPAGLAGQPTRLVLQSNFAFQKTCFTRLKAANDQTLDPDLVKAGQSYPQVCSNDGAAVVPQLAMTFKVNDRIGIGLAPLMTPSAGASKVSFPQFVQTTNSAGTAIYEPGPTRYLLTSANLLVITPTLGVGIEVVKGLRLGASFQWGIANLQFTNTVAGTVNSDGPNQPYSPASSDIKAYAKVHENFIPGVIGGAIYSPTNNFDIAGWYKWAAPIDAGGDIQTQVGYYNSAVAKGGVATGATGNTAAQNCGITSTPPTTLCGSGNNIHITVQQPMEAKIGFRYHKPRAGEYDEHLRDPLSQDVFDIEADLTWANDSAFKNLQIRLPSNQSGDGLLPVSGVQGAFDPPNADVPHMFKDVYGIRLGGDFNVLPDELAVRAGGFFQSSALNPQYQNIDFMASENFGFAFGGTYRLHLSKNKGNAIEISVGYEHVFYLNETNDGTTGVDALAGTPCPTGTSEVPKTYTCSNGATKYRSSWPINLGTITQSINVLNAGLGYKF